MSLHARTPERQDATPLWSCSLLSTLAPHASAPQLAELAVSHGASGLELRCEAGHAHGVELGLAAEERDRIRHAVEGRGVKIADLASPVRIGSSPADAFTSYLQLAEDVGARGVRVFCDDRRPEETESAWLERIAAASSAILGILGERTSGLWVENHGNTSDSSTLLRATDAHFGFVWDVGHSSSHGEEPDTVWKRIGDRVRHVHVKDWRRQSQGRWDRNCPLLEGDLRIEAALGLLDSARYEGWVSVEVPGASGLSDLRRLAEWRRHSAAADRRGGAARD